MNLSPTDKRLKQKNNLLKLIEKLFKKDLEEICVKFKTSKAGTKAKLKDKVIDLLENNNPDIKWSELRKEIRRVYNMNDKIKKSPKKVKRTKRRKRTEAPQEVPDLEDNYSNVSLEESTVPPIILKIPNPSGGQQSVNNNNNNNYGILSYFNRVNNPSQHLQQNINSANSYRYSEHPNVRPFMQPFPQQIDSSAGAVGSITPSVPQTNPFEPNYSNVNNSANYGQMNGLSVNANNEQLNNAYNSVLDPNRSLTQPFNPNQQNTYNSFAHNLTQPINYSMNNNYYQNNCFPQNYFQNQISDVLNPQNYGSFIEQQKFLLSQCSQSLQDKQQDSDVGIKEDFIFKCFPKYKIIKKLKETKTIGSLTDIGIEVEFEIKVLDLDSNYFAINSETRDLKSLLTKNSYQIQLRFSYITEVTVKEQKDCIPEYLNIDVNNNRIFTYSEDEETSGPFDLSDVCKLGFNRIKFSMSKENYTFLLPCLYEISIVSYDTPETFLSRLKQNIFQFLDSNSTKQLIKSRGEQLSQDESVISIMDTNTKVKLICPLSCRRIETPCRTVECKHIECFDAYTFFKTNEMRYEWVCPICQKSAQFDSLRIDGYFSEVLESAEDKVNEIFVKSNADYDVLNRSTPFVIELDDTMDEDYECSVVYDDDCIILD